jgi:hypothetical protein
MMPIPIIILLSLISICFITYSLLTHPHLINVREIGAICILVVSIISIVAIAYTVAPLSLRRN